MNKINKKSNILILLTGAFFALSCASFATKYQPLEFTGGYTQEEISKDTWLVKFKGNGYTNSETVQLYGFYRCAELTKEKGYKYFVVLENKDNVMSTYVPTTSINISNGKVSAKSSGGSTIKHSDVAILILLTNNISPEYKKENIFVAEDVIKNNRESIQMK